MLELRKPRYGPRTPGQHKRARDRHIGRVVDWLRRLRVDPDALIESLAAATSLETGVVHQVPEVRPYASEPSPSPGPIRPA